MIFYLMILNRLFLVFLFLNIGLFNFTVANIAFLFFLKQST